MSSVIGLPAAIEFTCDYGSHW